MKQLKKLIPKSYDAFSKSGRGKLTLREFAVLKFWALGYTKKQIADAIIMSADTADQDIRKIYTKLGVRTRHSAVLQGFLKGVLFIKDFKRVKKP